MLLILTTLMIVGCEGRTEEEREEAKRLGGFHTVVIDSCEYLKNDSSCYGNYGYGYFAHKGNCRFCKERREKELEKLIIELKGK